MSYFTCDSCKKEVVIPGTLVECLGCGKGRIRVCLECQPNFNGCNEECKGKAQKFMKNWMGKKIAPNEKNRVKQG